MPVLTLGTLWEVSVCILPSPVLLSFQLTPLWIVFCLGDKQSTSYKPLGLFLKTGLVTVETFHRCEQNTVLCNGRDAQAGQNRVRERGTCKWCTPCSGRCCSCWGPAQCGRSYAWNRQQLMRCGVIDTITQLWFFYEQKPSCSQFLLALPKILVSNSKLEGFFKKPQTLRVLSCTFPTSCC